MNWIRAAAALIGIALAACHSDAPTTPLSTEEAVIFEGALSNRLTPAGERGTVIARLHVAARAPEAARRAPANVALVVDTSGSMEGAAIEAARAAAATVVDGLADGDRLAVVAFSSRPEVLLPSTELDGDERIEVKQKLGRMRAEGTTDMAGGLREGLTAVQGHLDPQGINRVVLLGDGVPNDDATIRPLAEEARRNGISITALGLGADYNETLMGAVAQISGGRFHYVDDAKKVAAFFKDEVLRLQGVYAGGAAIELTPGPGVRVEEVIGQRAVPVGAKVRVELGDLSRGEGRDLFVRLAADPRRAGAPVELCDAVLSFDVPGVGRSERRVFLGARATSSAEDLAAGRDGAIERAAALAQSAAATLSAIELARAGRPDEARALLARVAAELDAIAARTGSAELREEATALRALGRDLPLPDAAPAAPAPRMPMPSPGAAPAALDLEAPSPAPAAAAPEAAESQARRLRVIHDEAMQRLQ